MLKITCILFYPFYITHKLSLKHYAAATADNERSGLENHRNWFEKAKFL